MLPASVVDPCLAAQKSKLSPVVDRKLSCTRLGNFARGYRFKVQTDYDVACVSRQAQQSSTDLEQLLLALQLLPEEASSLVQRETKGGRRCRDWLFQYDQQRILEPLRRLQSAETSADVESLLADSGKGFQRHYFLVVSWLMVRCNFEKKLNERELVRRKIIWYLRTVNNVLMRHRTLQTHQARLNLERLLTAIAKECPELGFEPSMVLFAATILDLFGHQQIRRSWYVFMCAYKSLCLSQYFAEDRNLPGEKTALRRDAEEVWDALQRVFPAISASFTKFGCESLFFEAAEDLLSSLLMSGYNADVSLSLESYVRLLEGILYAEAPASDPREQLRNAVFCVFARRWKAFEAAATRDNVTKLVKSFEDGMLIDDLTLQLFDAKLCCNLRLSTHASATLSVVGFGAYWWSVYWLGLHPLAALMPVGASAMGPACAIMLGANLSGADSIEEATTLLLAPATNIDHLPT